MCVCLHLSAGRGVFILAVEVGPRRGGHYNYLGDFFLIIGGSKQDGIKQYTGFGWKLPMDMLTAPDVHRNRRLLCVNHITYTLPYLMKQKKTYEDPGYLLEQISHF